MWQRIWRGLTALTGTSILTNLSGVLQASLTFRYLTTAEYGRLTLLLSFFAAAVTFFDLGIKGIFTSEMARARGQQDAKQVKGLWQLYGRYATVTALLATALFVLLGWWQHEPLWLLLAAYIALFGGNNALHTLLLSHTAYRRTAAQTLLRSLSRLLLLLTLPLWHSSSLLFSVTLTYPLMEFVTLLFTLWRSQPILQPLRPIAPQPVRLRPLLQEQGVYTVLAQPLNRIIIELPVWLLQALVGETAVGVYGAARKGFRLFTGLFAPLETVFMPLVPEQLDQAPDRVRVALRQAQKYSFWLALLLILIIFPLAPFLIGLLAGDGYGDVVTPFRWLLLTMLFTPFIQFHRPILFALKQQRWLLFFQIASLLTYAPLLWLFIQHSGAVGAAQVLVINGIIHLVLRVTAVRHIAPHLWPSPLTLFRLEPFDRQLLTKLRQRNN